jgi:O-antigen/teichoic acid export membrane protein
MIRGVLAELLFPITALATGAFLTRRLGPEGYGLLVLAAALVTWIEWSLNAFFSRPTIKLIGETDEWQPLADGIVRLQFVAGLVIMGVLWLVAAPFSRLLDEPELARYLRLFSLDIPIFCLAHSHRSVLVGRGHFASSANLSAVRWIARLVLILALVGAGFSVSGAIVGTIGASVLEVIVARRYIRPSVVGIPRVRPLWSIGLPLFISSLCLSLYSRVDLFALKALGGSAEDAGLYGAAQNLSLLPSVFTIGFLPMLLSTLSRLVARGEAQAAREIGTNVMRGVLALLPIAAIVSGAAREIMIVFFGRDFGPGAITLAPLIFGSFVLIMIPVVTAIYTAEGKPGRAVALTVPLLPLAIAGHLVFIPRFGAIGAATVTAVVAVAGAAWAFWSAVGYWRIAPPVGTFVRSAAISIVVFIVAALWPTPGAFVLLKLPVLVVACLVFYALLGEFSSSEVALVRAWIARAS